MQLVAMGAQDVFLTGNPQITFFKVVYRRHTNFSKECIKQEFNGSGASLTCTLSRNGDLVKQMYLEVDLPVVTGPANATWVYGVGNALVKEVELEIGGQRIDKHTGHWMECWAELTENKTGRAVGTNFQTMSGYGAGVANKSFILLISVPGAGLS